MRTQVRTCLSTHRGGKESPVGVSSHKQNCICCLLQTLLALSLFVPSWALHTPCSASCLHNHTHAMSRHTQTNSTSVSPTSVRVYVLYHNHVAWCLSVLYVLLCMLYNILYYNLSPTSVYGAVQCAHNRLQQRQ